MVPKKKPIEPAPVAPVTNRISDVVWQSLIAGLVTIALGYMSYRNGAKADVAAIKVEEVRKTLQTSTIETDGKLNDLADVAAATHTLVNSNFAVQLQLNARVSRRLAKETKDPEDERAADLAEKLYQEHEDKQKTVDQKKN